MALMGALEKAVPIATLVFVVSSMLAMGLGLKVAQVTAPLRNLRLVALSLLANFVLMPASAVLLARVLRLDEPLGVGLLLLGAAAGAPFLPKLTQIAKGNLAFAVALMVLLMVITVAYMPLMLPILLPGVSVNPVRIALSLVLTMLLPLGVALGGPGAGHATRPGLGHGAAQHCRGARGGQPKLQQPQCRRHGGRRRHRQSPDTPADVAAACQEG